MIHLAKVIVDPYNQLICDLKQNLAEMQINNCFSLFYSTMWAAKVKTQRHKSSKDTRAQTQTWEGFPASPSSHSSSTKTSDATTILLFFWLQMTDIIHGSRPGPARTLSPSIPLCLTDSVCKHLCSSEVTKAVSDWQVESCKCNYWDFQSICPHRPPNV